MLRIIAALALLLIAAPASALERSPADRGIVDRDRGGERTAPERGERMSGGRDRSFYGGDARSSRSYPQREHSGRSGDRD